MHSDLKVSAAAVDDKSCQDKDRKSTRLNSSHGYISYAVFCLKKKTKVSISTAAIWSVGIRLASIGAHALPLSSSFCSTMLLVAPPPTLLWLKLCYICFHDDRP